MSATQISSTPASSRRKNFVGVNITNILDSLGCYDDVGQQICIILLHQMLTTYASTETPDAERYAVYLWFFEGEPDYFGRTFEEILYGLNIDHHEDYILGFAMDICPSSWSVKAYRQYGTGVQQSLF